MSWCSPEHIPFGHISVEIDCSELVGLWENKRSNRSLIAPLLEEVSALSLEFQPFSISFACRSANNEEWTGASPFFLQNKLRADCNGASVIS
jgi:hypothetical protein